MKACSLLAFSLLLASAATKQCLDIQGRFNPRIFLGQFVTTTTTTTTTVGVTTTAAVTTAASFSSPFTASDQALENPKELHAQFSVGSYNVPREMGIDMHSALTIIQADNITVTPAITVDPYYEDVLQSLLAYTRQNMTQNSAVQAITRYLSQFYVPYLSEFVNYWSKWKHYETSYQSYGHMVEDRICFSTATNANWCYRQSFLTSHWFTQNINPCTGVLGLGFGTNKYGKNFVQNLADNSNGFLSPVWTYATGPFIGNTSLVQVGSINLSIVRSTSNINYYSVQDSSRWMISMSTVAFNGVGLSQSSTSGTKILFNILSDSISLPTQMYAQAIQQLQNAVPKFRCTSATRQCILDDTCGCAAQNTPSLTFTINNQRFTVPARNLLAENDNATCSFLVQSQGDVKITDIEVGQPFFRGFYTIYDVANRQVGIVAYPSSYAFQN